MRGRIPWDTDDANPFAPAPWMREAACIGGRTDTHGARTARAGAPTLTGMLPKVPDLVADLVGEHFQKWRKGRGQSRESVAMVMECAGFGWTYDIVGRIERGERTLGVPEVVALATLLEEDVLDIIPTVYVPRF